MSDPDHDHEPGPDSSHQGVQPVPPAPAPSASVLSLNSLLETVYASAAAQARDNGDRALEHLLAHYFPLDPQSGRMAPKTVQVALPGPNGTPILRDVPLFSLANHQGVAIESFVVKMKTALTTHTQADGTSSLMLDLGAADDASRATAEIEVRFHGTAAAQGIARINDAIVKQIGWEER